MTRTNREVQRLGQRRQLGLRRGPMDCVGISTSSWAPGLEVRSDSKKECATYRSSSFSEPSASGWEKRLDMFVFLKLYTFPGTAAEGEELGPSDTRVLRAAGGNSSEPPPDRQEERLRVMYRTNRASIGRAMDLEKHDRTRARNAPSFLPTPCGYY